MNKIKLTFTIVEGENGRGNLAKILMPHLSVDDRLINEGFTVDMKELINSTIIDGEHYIVTSWNRYPGSEGIFEGFLVTHCQRLRETVPNAAL